MGYLVVQGYGLTETAPIVTLSHPFHVRGGTVGKPLGGVEVRIAPDGEILVRGDNVTTGYFESPGETSAAFEDGWFHTGDVGDLDSEGHLKIRGRKKEMIVTPEGLKVFPEDVEKVLAQIPGVRESAVIGKDRVHAVTLILDTGVNAEDVVRQANLSLEDHQKICQVSCRSDGELRRARADHREAASRRDCAGDGDRRRSPQASRPDDRSPSKIRARPNHHARDDARRTGTQLARPRPVDD